MFAVDPAFETGSAALASLPLSEVRLQRDARFPWLIVIPRRANAREIEDLTRADRSRLVEEVIVAGRAVRAMGEALGSPVLKLNIAALGNLTAQLHVHVVGRRSDDPAWPGSVWGLPGAAVYAPADESAVRAAALLVLTG